MSQLGSVVQARGWQVMNRAYPSSLTRWNRPVRSESITAPRVSIDAASPTESLTSSRSSVDAATSPSTSTKNRPAYAPDIPLMKRFRTSVTSTPDFVRSSTMGDPSLWLSGSGVLSHITVDPSAVHWLSLLLIKPRPPTLAASTNADPSRQLTLSMPAASMTVPGCSPPLTFADSQMTSLPLARSSSCTSSSSRSVPLPLDFRTSTESSPRLTGPTPSWVHTFFGFDGEE